MSIDITKISRFNKQLLLILVDSFLAIFILLISFSARLGYFFIPETKLFWIILCSPIIAIPIFMYFGLYRSILRFIGFDELWKIVQAVSLFALIWGLGSLLFSDISSNFSKGIPRSIIFINWALLVLSIGGVRFLGRTLILGKLSFLTGPSKNKSMQKKALVYGAGDAGIQLVSALKHSSEYQIVGYIDDFKELHGKKINGLSVFPFSDITHIIHKSDVQEIFIMMPSASRKRRYEIYNKLKGYPVNVRLLPGVAELAEGKVNIADLKDVKIQDLLGRQPVEPNKDLLSKNITNKVVLVTGAGGSIGSELCSQILLLKPRKLVLYERNELALYSVDKKLSTVNLDIIEIYPILGSITNKLRLSKVFQKYGVETVYHAAAYKHVPLVELNNSEGVFNNVFGTLICANVAIDEMIETFVLISTDKAVRPTNIMGATKRFSELILQALSRKQNVTIFSMVRFGNVLGSSGSVIPLFKDQIKNGGPVTVTDKNITRYFMTISEAVQLVIQAGAMGTGGDVFVLDMGEPVRINDLAIKMIEQSGLEVKDKLNPNGDIEIKYLGLRPGEKLYEELLIGGNVTNTKNPLIMRAQENMIEWSELTKIITALEAAIQDSNYKEIRSNLIQAIPEFNPKKEINDLMLK
jgi:FlaA1/EpsC-like NDP-sugar epimerase